MSTGIIPDLWPDDIRVDVLDPVAILRAQQDSLNTRTHGLLRAEIRTWEHKKDEKEEDGQIIHSFDLVAPVLGKYRVVLMTATHLKSLIYPVLVQSRIFDPEYNPNNLAIPKTGGYLSAITAISALAMVGMIDKPAKPDPQYRLAATQDEFVNLVGDVLRSVWVRSLIQSLIARSNAAPQDKPNISEPSSDKPSEP